MKKIDHIQQLHTEKMRLQQQQKDLEKNILTKWLDIKYSLKPANIAREAIIKILNNQMENKMAGKGLLNICLTYGLTLLAGKLAGNTEGNLINIFKRPTNRLQQ
jgi:hypothetical protein